MFYTIRDILFAVVVGSIFSTTLLFGSDGQRLMTGLPEPVISTVADYLQGAELLSLSEVNRQSCEFANTGPKEARADRARLQERLDHLSQLSQKKLGELLRDQAKVRQTVLSRITERDLLTIRDLIQEKKKWNPSFGRNKLFLAAFIAKYKIGMSAAEHAAGTAAPGNKSWTSAIEAVKSAAWATSGNLAATVAETIWGPTDPIWAAAVMDAWGIAEDATTHALSTLNLSDPLEKSQAAALISQFAVLNWLGNSNQDYFRRAFDDAYSSNLARVPSIGETRAIILRLVRAADLGSNPYIAELNEFLDGVESMVPAEATVSP